MESRPGEPSPRIELIDALRGSALFGILLLHSIEHWDFLRNPEHAPAWLQSLNGRTHDLGFFLFGGKAYAIFAMMFGVSFFIILDRWSRRGITFQGRFVWRLTVLAILGYLHGIIYCGDILLVLAVLGLPLVFLYRLGNRALLWISLVLVLQLPSLWETARVLFEQGYQPVQPRHWAIYGRLFQVYSDGSLLDVVRTNLWQGQWARIWWTIETGRYTQMIGLFVWGLLLGRARLFEDPVRAVRLATRALLWGAIGFAIIYPVKLHLGAWIPDDLDRYVVDNLVSSYCNLAQMAVWAGGFVLLYQWAKARAALRLLAPYGRMSLTGYVTQGLVGVPLFYGFGLGLYRYLGPFYSVLLGAGYFAIQCAIARLWLARFAYGPLEWLWRACTFVDFRIPMRRRLAPAPPAAENAWGDASVTGPRR
jgi:uncharacterized protein